jgi:hypothetical protein
MIFAATIAYTFDDGPKKLDEYEKEVKEKEKEACLACKEKREKAAAEAAAGEGAVETRESDVDPSGLPAIQDSATIEESGRTEARASVRDYSGPRPSKKARESLSSDFVIPSLQVGIDIGSFVKLLTDPMICSPG